MNEDSETSVGEFVSNPDAEKPSDALEEAALREEIEEVLSSLSPREEKVVRMRYGIGVRDSLTLEEVGARMDVTRERIRQIEAKALRKLRHPARSERLRSFLDTGNN